MAALVLGLLAVLLLGDGMLAIEHRRADGNGRQNVDPVHPQVALGIHVTGAPIMKRLMAPSTV